MIPVLSDFEREKLEHLKEITGVAPADELIKLIVNGPSMSPSMRESIIDALNKAGERVGNFALERAFLEGILTEEEWRLIHSERGLSIGDMGCVLMPIFEKEKNPDEEVALMTTHDSPIYKNKEFILERFKVMVMDPKEAVDLMNKEDNNG